MPKPLTLEQLQTLRAVPMASGIPNRLRLALALVNVRQSEVSAETEITASNLSDIVNGKYTNVTIATGQKLADFFGCAIEDLFPSREAVA